MMPLWKCTPQIPDGTHGTENEISDTENQFFQKADASDTLGTSEYIWTRHKKTLLCNSGHPSCPFEVTFSWAGSPGFLGGDVVRRRTRTLSHIRPRCRNTPRWRRNVSHMRIIAPWEQRESVRVPEEASVRPATGGGLVDPFFTSVYIDDYMLARVQHVLEDQTALIASTSLVSDHIRLFGPGDPGTTLSSHRNTS